jgi:hypothetical protein
VGNFDFSVEYNERDKKKKQKSSTRFTSHLLSISKMVKNRNCTLIKSERVQIICVLCDYLEVVFARPVSVADLEEHQKT